MKNKASFLFTLFMAVYSFALSQSFTAESGDIYITDDPLKYSCSVTVLTGTLKKTDKVDFYAPKGTKFTATILEMTQNYEPVNEIKAGQFGSIVVKFSQSFSGLKDYPTYKSKILPSGSSADNTTVSTENNTAVPHFTTLLNGKEWKGKITYKGALLGRNGFRPLNINKPCMQIQFASTTLPDDRTLTIQVFYPKESPAKYTAKDLEVLFIGSETGQKENILTFGFVNGKSMPNFTFEVKEWKNTGNNKAKISGEIKGELPETVLLGKSDRKITFTNGTFKDVEVEIINE